MIHWLPLEQFPPAFNLLNLLAEDEKFEAHCCTTHAKDGKPVRLHANVVSNRTAFPSRSMSRLRRILLFLLFPLHTLWYLLKTRPDVLLYVEPHSAPAAALYCLMTRCRLFIHYHEYRNPTHFLERGNGLARLGRWLEQMFLHSRAEWISHTNEMRLRLFQRDFPKVSPNSLRAMPNYPPVAWTRFADGQLSNAGQPRQIRLLYVGALSLRDTWIKELFEWISRQNPDAVSLDLYISTTDAPTLEFLNRSSAKNVRVTFPGISYDDLPAVLGNYDVGLILYRGTTDNYIWNAPNKLFEYLVCGLDVWYPREMRGIPAEVDCTPDSGVIEVDFRRLPELQSIFRGRKFRPTRRFTCFDATRPLFSQLLCRTSCNSPRKAPHESAGFTGSDS